MIVIYKFMHNIIISKHVVPGGAMAIAPPDVGISVNPISTKGADYTHQMILVPPDFQTIRRHS